MNKAKKHRSQSISTRLRQISPAKKQQVGTRMQIAVNLDEALKAKGWKRIQLADALGVDRSLITKWLSGTHNFTIDTLVQLSVVLEVALADLILEAQPSISKVAKANQVVEASNRSVSPQYQGSITIDTLQSQFLIRDTGQYFPLSLDTQSTYQFSAEKLNPEDKEISAA